MALWGLLGLIVASVFATFAKWRLAIPGAILVVALQDPVRKLTPGTPGWMTLLVVPLVVAGLMAMFATVPDVWRRFARNNPKIAQMLALLVLLSIPSIIISLTFGPGSWQFTFLGVFSYSIIFLSVLLGYFYARDIETALNLLATYCLIHGVVLIGALVEYLDLWPGAQIIGSHALGYEWIRWIPGYTVEMISGFYRSSDVMGWHAAMVCMLSVTLAIAKSGKARFFWVLVSAWAVLALLLCGRRKMVYMLPIFILVLTWIYFSAGRASRVLPMIGFLIVPAASVLVTSDMLGENTANIRYYTSANEGDSTLDRLQSHGLGEILETYRQMGFFGAGLGFGTPGSHHINANRPRVWQESGPGRVMAELGVPGFLCFLATLAAIGVVMWRVTRTWLIARTREGVLCACLMSVAVANLGSLTISGQILADVFVVVFLGFLVGLVLSFGRRDLVELVLQRNQGRSLPAFAE